jgi:hypothetical protein
MKPCGIKEIDKENKALIKKAQQAILTKKNIEEVLQKISDFRMKLAYNKTTELLESNFGWTKIYDDLIESLSKKD